MNFKGMWDKSLVSGLKCFPALIGQIKSIQSHETLKLLFKQCFRATSLEEFAGPVDRVTTE